MKYTKVALLFFLVMVVSVSCKRTERPETVLVKFANHFAKSEFEEAKKYATAETIKHLEMIQALASIGFYQEEENVQIISESDISCTVEGNRALCTYIEYGDPIEVTLVKIDNRWLIDIPVDNFEEENWLEDGEGFEDEEEEPAGLEVI
jgi:hypothetical protein